MDIALRPETQRLIEERMKHGGYQSADDAVRAGMLYLEQQEHAGDFEPGELDALLAIADGEIERGELLDGEGVFKELRDRSKSRESEGG